MNMGKSFCSLWLGIIFCIFSSGAEAYVMPPEQLIDYMQDKLGAFKTLIIDQKTVVMDPRDGKEVNAFEEKIWVKTPGFFESKVISGQEMLARRPMNFFPVYSDRFLWQTAGSIS